jgi:hypothetical protein
VEVLQSLRSAPPGFFVVCTPFSDPPAVTVGTLPVPRSASGSMQAARLGGRLTVRCQGLAEEGLGAVQVRGGGRRQREQTGGEGAGCRSGQQG